jgi:hypothetical protein
MEPTITIVDTFNNGTKMRFVLHIDDMNTDYVGCSVRGTDGVEHGMGLHKCRTPDIVVWEIRIPSSCSIGPQRGLRGEVIFALWTDDQFTRRIASTGWIAFNSPWLGGSSGKSADYADATYRERYGEIEVWR